MLEVTFRPRQRTIEALPELFENEYQTAVQEWLAECEPSKDFTSRINAGDKSLTNVQLFGVTLGCNPDGSVGSFIFPETLTDIIDGQHRMVERWLREGRIKERDVLRLGILYEVDEEIGCYLPGDCLPPGAKPLQGIFDHRIWEHYVQNGILPMCIDVFEHDVFGHALALSTPQAMISYSELSRRGKDPTYAHSLRLIMLTETLECPDLTKRDEIKALVPELFIKGSKGHFNFINSLSDEELSQRIDRLLHAFPSLTLKSGAALIDSYNRKVFHHFCACIHECCQDSVSDFPLVPSSYRKTYCSIAQSTMVRVLSELHEYLLHGEQADFSEEKSYLVDYLKSKIQEDPKLHIRKMACELLTRIEISLYAGVKFNLDPIKMQREGSRARFFRHTDTAKYYREYLRPFTRKNRNNELALYQLGYK